MSEEIATTDRIQQAIRLYQGHKVMLDFDLASLYGVTTGALNRQVKRNRDRFPPDFVYDIHAQDVTRLICQNGISKVGRGGRRRPVLAFTPVKGTRVAASKVFMGRPLSRSDRDEEQQFSLWPRPHIRV